MSMTLPKHDPDLGVRVLSLGKIDICSKAIIPLCTVPSHPTLRREQQTG